MPTLNWIGKDAVVNHHRQVPYHLLRCDEKLSVGDPGSGNLLVQGDNLLALKALLPYYAGQVKCIYIDPPYNTGNENWVYNDNVNSPEIRKWLGHVVGGEAEDLSRHDKWLCMMYPRLSLLREFLREDGAIFISIDDIEVSSLRLLCDEVFGKNNFVAHVLWQKKYASSNDHTSIAPMHDFILVYRKSDLWHRGLLPRTAAKDRQYRFEDEIGIFRISDYTCNKNAEERPNLFYAITNPKTGKEVWPSKTRVWAYSKEKHEENERNGLVWWGKDGTSEIPSFKRYRSKLKRGGGIVPNTWWPHDFAGHTDEAKKEYNALVGRLQGIDFQTPKPSMLIERILQISTDKDSLVLDSFAGSGTTGHAVLAANKADGGSRRFILVEMEPDICEHVTAQRLTRVIHGYEAINGNGGKKVEGLGGGFRFCKLSHPIFDENGQIHPEVRFADLAAHVFFTETGEPIPKRPNGKRPSPLIGVCNGTAYYLLFNGVLGDKRPDGGNVLTGRILDELPDHDGPKVVYGEGCRLSPSRLKRMNITFKQVPYEIKVS